MTKVEETRRHISAVLLTAVLGEGVMLPKVIVCDELPQWITSSDKAAFHPFGNAIYIRSDQGLHELLHEYGHWAGCCLRMGWIHRWLDRSKANVTGLAPEGDKS